MFLRIQQALDTDPSTTFFLKGYREGADLILFNTCSVREKAQEKVFSDLGRVKHLKARGVKIGVGGCVASQEGAAIIERAPYVDVVFGPQTLHRLPALIGADAQRVAVVRPASLADRAQPLVAALATTYDVVELPLPDGEAAKTAAVAATCWEALGAAGFTRSDVVVTFGGGATTDVGGFVAATWLRGVRVVHVPTGEVVYRKAAFERIDTSEEP